MFIVCIGLDGVCELETTELVGTKFCTHVVLEIRVVGLASFFIYFFFFRFL